MNVPRIDPPPAGGPVDGEGAPGTLSSGFAPGLDCPPEAGFRPQPQTPVTDSRPLAATSPDGAPAGHSRNWRLPAAASSVTVLRRGLNDFLHGAPLSEDERYDLLLAVCEAASNAIEHAGYPNEPFFEVLTEVSDAGVTIIVRDHGQWCDDAPGTYRGRGLAMMWVLADTTVAPGPDGTTVTIRSRPRHRRPPGSSAWPA